LLFPWYSWMNKYQKEWNKKIKENEKNCWQITVAVVF
jgi:hypothetical protein